MYRKIRLYSSDVHIFEFDPYRQKSYVDNGVDGKLEPLSKLGGVAECKINASFFDAQTPDGYAPSAYFLPVSLSNTRQLKINCLETSDIWQIGGSFTLIVDGKRLYLNSEKYDHFTQRHPRTAIGQRVDGTIVCVVVQGRQILQRGVDGAELADIMLQQGCINAVNLDGGGSSEMIVDGAIKNKPTDGHERAIATGLIIEREVKQMVYVSPSTQEMNIGAGNYGTEEGRMNQIADLLIPMLEYNGIRWARNSPTMTLAQVVADSNAKGADIHVAIHSNAMGGVDAGKARGCEVWYYTGSSNGKRIAQAIYNHLSPLTPTTDRGLKDNTTFMELNSTKCPSCIVEVAFHDNLQDAQWILANMQSIAEAICKGICEYYSIAYKSNAVDYKAKYEALLNKIIELGKGV